MSNPGTRCAAAVRSASVTFQPQPLRTPLVLSSGALTELTEARVSVTVRTAAGEATGRGSIYLSGLWAWPDVAAADGARCERVLRAWCAHVADRLPHWCADSAHPLEHGLCLHEKIAHPESDAPDTDAPMLARAMCASPFDAALHDATGQALGRSAFAFYDEPGVALPRADAHLGGHAGDAMAAISQLLRRSPESAVDAWLIVGKNDDLDEAVAPWVTQRGYRCFKLKLMGQDAQADAQRTSDVYRAVRRFGAASPRLSVDTNEANPDAASVRQYLDALGALDAEAFDALAYLEQPTGRDIERHAYDWSPVTALKPVLLDEGLTDLALLPTAERQGWSGLALKTCKGHSFALAAGAWAHQRGRLIALQDLTNPGYAAIHAALFAMHVPTLNGVELNAPQFTPAANDPWQPRLAGLFAPTDGRHRLADPAPPGLGSGL